MTSTTKLTWEQRREIELRSRELVNIAAMLMVRLTGSDSPAKEIYM